MKKLVLSALVVGMSYSAISAEVGGDAEIKAVVTGHLITTNVGLENKQSVSIASVQGKGAKVGGNFKTDVDQQGLVISTNVGSSNIQEVAVGSVSQVTTSTSKMSVLSSLVEQAGKVGSELVKQLPNMVK